MNNLITGIKGAEGPCVTRDGRLLMVGSEVGRIIEVLPEGQQREIANTGGIPAELQIDSNGELWVADMELGVLRVTLAGQVFPEVTHFEDHPIRGCNDCYFDSIGNLYFTAPSGSSADDRCGELFCRLAEGQVIRLDAGFAFCNGVAVSVDDTTLIVAETLTRRLYAYDICRPGHILNKRLWATLPEGGIGPDGMDFDSDSRLLVAYYGGGTVEIFEPDGIWLRAIRVPARDVTNVHFRGPGSNQLLITEMSSGGLWQCEYSATGQMQYGWQTLQK